MNKNGLSPTITIVLLILLGVAAVAIVWVSVMVLFKAPEFPTFNVTDENNSLGGNTDDSTGGNTNGNNGGNTDDSTGGNTNGNNGANPVSDNLISGMNLADNFVFDGTTYNIANGKLYSYNSDSKSWTFIQSAYDDPDYYSKNYEVVNGKVFIKGSNGELFESRKEFNENFEGVSRLNDLINPLRNWTTLTLLSPTDQTVVAYNARRDCVLAGTCNFADNRVEVSSQFGASGSSLKSYAVTPPMGSYSSGETGSKAALGSVMIYYKNGDDFWYSADYYVEEGMPFTIFELASTWSDNWPGIRIMLQDDGTLGYEFKWMDKPRYVQTGNKVLFPTGKWVNVKVHFKLSNRDDGIIQLWQDNNLVIDTTGKNLPFNDAIYNFFNVGICNMKGNAPTSTVYVDNVRVSDKPL
jgi:hypothetical protein